MIVSVDVIFMITYLRKIASKNGKEIVFGAGEAPALLCGKVRGFGC